MTVPVEPRNEHPLQILHLEDDPRDVELVRDTLEAEGVKFEARTVCTRGEFTAALEGGGVEVILSDFALPSFDGLSALEIACRLAPDLPFIFVSGTLGEEAAIDAVRQGATDYVLKQRLSRLAPAVRRAVSEMQQARRRREVEEALRRTEEQLRHTQKMEAVGRLAGGVAHDFNNILTAIMGYGELLLARLEPSDPNRLDVEEIQQAAKRAASLTRQLLAFSRHQVLEPRVLDLRGVIGEMDNMLRRIIGADIDFKTLPSAELGCVRVDPGQIQQVLLNLAVNARDAMPEGGKLTIETANLELDEVYARDHIGVAPGPYVMLAVSDTGCGMDADTQSRIFEPFFTTKEGGKGTGLGLSMVYGIAQQSGGHVDVYSEPGKGSTFKVFLPRVEADRESGGSRVLVGPPARGSETLLLVDDDVQVRSVIRESLKLNGYTVLEAGDGVGALRFFDDGGPEIDLVVCDVIMPEMSGPEFVDRISVTHPDTRVLFISGFTVGAVVHRGVLRPGVNFLLKPFTPEILLRKVREALQQPRRMAA